MNSFSGNASPTGSMVAFDFHVSDEDAGVRFDHFLVQAVTDISRSCLVQSIRMGLFLVDGHKKKSSYRLKSGERILGSIYEAPPQVLVPQPVPFNILFEDEFLLVISKPPGIVVHPAAGNPDGTLVNGLLYHCKEIANVGDEVRPGIVHRLDKDTSGVMVVAKSSLCHRLLVDIFKEREVEKEYLALVHGHLRERQGRIITSIDRHPVQRQKMTVCEEHHGRYAASRWQVLEEYAEGCSLLRVGIETGRTHQIRVHMASLGHPVAGDNLYGRARNTRSYPRQMLHAHCLRFVHPVTGATMDYTAPAWSDFQLIIDQLRDLEYEKLLNGP